LIEFGQHEVERYREEGRDYLLQLAGQVQNSAPIMKGSMSPFRDRKLGQEEEEAVHDTVMKWKSTQGT
jgi:hypothetical protein